MGIRCQEQREEEKKRRSYLNQVLLRTPRCGNRRRQTKLRTCNHDPSPPGPIIGLRCGGRESNHEAVCWIGRGTESASSFSPRTGTWELLIEMPGRMRLGAHRAQTSGDH